MPGIATKFEILELALVELRKPASGAALNAIAATMDANPAFARLGVIGPALADFLPSAPPAPGQAFPQSYAGVWQTLFALAGGDLGLFKTLTDLRTDLDDIQQIVVDEDFDALKQFKEDGRAQAVMDSASNFEALVGTLQSTALDLAQTIGTGLRPVVCTASPTDPVPDPSTWTTRDLMHWKHTGLFARTLIDKAAGNEEHLAYAYGWLVSYAAHACGSPFLNSAVGGPSRTQWWRQRFVRNYVDAWAYGLYQTSATMSGDTPTPPYASWPELCSRNYQDDIGVAGTVPDPADLMERIKTRQPFPAGILPAEFGAYWSDCFQSVYGTPTAASGVSAGGLNDAYLTTWLVLWFMTSGAVFGCALDQPMQPPGGCSDAPSELDPFQVDPATGGPAPPPAAQPDVDISAGAVICGVIMVIFGGVLYALGSTTTGAALISAGIDEAEGAGDVNWQDLRCKLFWLQMYLYNGLKGIHQLLAISGFGYPHPEELGDDETALSLLGATLTWKTGKNLVMSQPSKRDYPSKPWDGALTSFNNPPTANDPGFETPATESYGTAAYPTFFINDPANPLSNGDVKTRGNNFPDRETTNPNGAVVPVEFGNVVANVVDLFQNLGATFPDWNLDGDRGMAYLTWQFQGFYDPDAVAIEPES